MYSEFKDKVIFITGAASGMGRATAVKFGECGARVAVAARNEKGGAETVRMVEEAGGQAAFFKCDVSNEKDVEDAIAAVVGKYGALDYAFNAAGCGADGARIPFAPLTETTDENWKKVIDTNLTGMFYCLKYELRQMGKQGHGAIVNTSSIGGLKMAPGFGAYGPSKAAVIAITQTAAVENAKAGIRVNAICPGPTMGTNLMANSIDSGTQDPEFMAEHVIPLGRMGTTEDVVNAVMFLCSSLSSDITGMAMPVCGGMQM